MILLRLLLLLVCAALISVGALAAETDPTERLTVVTSSGSHIFSVEVMRSPAELEKGLMFRRRMPQDHGMLFDFGAPQSVSMWMKNTYLPLDMLFIGANGHVVSVKEQAQPLSEDIISSGGPVVGVLEINGGVVKRIGARPGDRVLHSIFKP